MDKSVDRVHGVVDHGQGSDRSSPEYELIGTVGLSSLLRWHGEKEGGVGNLSTGSPGAER
jgi:hypothetical protein